MRSLPDRYLEAVLPSDRPNIRSALLTQRGEFLLKPPRFYRPFTAIDIVSPPQMSFLWLAKIDVAPFITIDVRDAFEDGRGSTLARIRGLWTVADAAGTHEMALGSLQRLLAEAVWCPTMLVPGDALQWMPLDDRSARATLTVAHVKASLDFQFDADGLITSVFSASRPRATARGFVPTPWRGDFSGYERRSGMLIPMRGQVAWLLPEGQQIYWRGEITNAAYDLTAS